MKHARAGGWGHDNKHRKRAGRLVEKLKRYGGPEDEL